MFYFRSHGGPRTCLSQRSRLIILLSGLILTLWHMVIAEQTGPSQESVFRSDSATLWEYVRGTE